MKHTAELVSLATLLLVLGCGKREPPTSPATSAGSATRAESPGTAPTAEATAPFACPLGPFDAPLSGELRATALTHSEPVAAQPGDTTPHLYEGPVWWRAALHFSDFSLTAGFPSRVLRHDPQTGLTSVIDDSGSNGLALTPDGKLAGARHKSKSIASFSEDGTGATDIAATFEGKRFNSPNDLTFRQDGNVYFTDPDFQAGGTRTQAKTSVYRVTPSGDVSVVDDTIQNPNGVSLSPDQNTLYVAGNLEHGYVRRYSVSSDGSVGPGSQFLDGVAVPDGMAVDCAGNVYVTEHTNRRVRVVTAVGIEIGQIVGMDANVTNAAFGGPDRKTLFITGAGRLWSVSLPLPGLPY